MASFQKRGKTWQYTISRMVNGKSDPIRKGGFRTKGEAQDAAREVESKLKKGISPVTKPIPFDTYFSEWIKLYKSSLSSNTQARYDSTLVVVKKYFGATPIQEINKRSYQLFLNDYGKIAAKATVKKVNSMIRACVKDAIDEDIIYKDFTRGCLLTGKSTTNKLDRKHLDYFEAKRVIKHLCEHSKTTSHYLILLGLTSGLRFGELVGLTRQDFNFKTNELSITKTWGYSNKMHTGFGPTKNEQSVRIIKMDEQTMNIFRDFFERTPDNMYGLVFYSPTSQYKVISNSAVNTSIKELLESMKIKPISVHGLRHTHASLLLYKKVSIYYVSERLGHKDITVTNKVYAHIIKELREEDEKNTVGIFHTMSI